MSFDNDKSEWKFEDKPPIATMIAGGLFFSIFLFFVIKWIIRNLTFPGSPLLPYAVAVIIIIMSIAMGTQVDVVIKINEKTAKIYAEDHTKYWEGSYSETKKFLVLQRERVIDDTRIYIEYKLYLELGDNSSYEIPLTTDIARKAIEVIDKIKTVT